MKSFNEAFLELRAGKYANVYFLQGEEPFFIDSIIKYIKQHAIPEEQKNFNQIVLYGKDITITDLLVTARKYPMMGDRQVIIVKEAKEIKNWNQKEAQEVLVNYLKNPLKTTILVFSFKNKVLDRRTTLCKTLEKHAVFLHAKKKYDNELPAWIIKYCNINKINIEAEATQLLVENIGNNLQTLANEIDKLVTHLKPNDMLSSNMIRKFTGISKDYNIFELQKAIGVRDNAKTYKIITYFASNPIKYPLVLTIHGLFTFFSKLLLIHHAKTTNKDQIAKLTGIHPFFVKEYLIAVKNYPLQKVIDNIGYLHEADLQSKSIGFAPKKVGSILTELMIRLIDRLQSSNYHAKLI